MSEVGLSGSACRARAGSISDIDAVAKIYTAAFMDQPLLDYIFPNRKANKQVFYTWIHRRFQSRYWNPGYSLTVVDGSDGRPVGFTWWHQPAETLSFFERYLSPKAWVGRFVDTVASIRDYFLPLPNYDAKKATVFKKVMDKAELGVLTTPKRCSARYLSILAVDPTLQSRGVGKVLIEHGLQKADQEGVASWLVSVEGLENYYSRHGFVEVGRANVDELKEWKGGAIMFRE